MKQEKERENDIYECKRKIKAILSEYNCTIETDDCHSAWIRDYDTDQTTGIYGGQ